LVVPAFAPAAERRLIWIEPRRIREQAMRATGLQPVARTR
jgi:hypothetical protein